jgi:uroporphyrinogen-III synthase
MQKNRIPILSTKKLSPFIINQAKEKGIYIKEKEFISIKPIHTKETYDQVMALVLNKNISTIVFTSSKAVAVIKNYLHQADTWYVPNWNIFCLSEKTKDSLNPNIPVKRIIATAENASSLAQKIIEHGIKEIIFFCSIKRRDELPKILKDKDVNVREIPVYETIKTPVALTKDYDGILFFSPSAVTSFFSINQLNKKIICFAIGKTTADTIKQYTDNKIIVSESPSQEMMLETVNFYFQNINCYE